MKKWWLAILPIISSASLTATNFRPDNNNYQTTQNTSENKTRSVQTRDTQQKEDEEFNEEQLITEKTEEISFEKSVPYFQVQAIPKRATNESTKTYDLNKIGFETDGSKIGYIEFTIEIVWLTVNSGTGGDTKRIYSQKVKVDLSESNKTNYVKQDTVGTVTNGARFLSQIEVAYSREQNQINVKYNQWTILNQILPMQTYVKKTKLVTHFENVKLYFKYSDWSSPYNLQNMDDKSFEFTFIPSDDQVIDRLLLIRDLSQQKYEKNNYTFNFTSNFAVSDIDFLKIYKAIQSRLSKVSFNFKITAPHNIKFFGSTVITMNIKLEYRNYPKDTFSNDLLSDKNDLNKPDLEKDQNTNFANDETKIKPEELKDKIVEVLPEVDEKLPVTAEMIPEANGILPELNDSTNLYGNHYIVLSELPMENLEIKFEKEMKVEDFDPVINKFLNNGNDLKLKMLVDYEISFVNSESQFDEKESVDLLVKGISPKVIGKNQIKINNNAKETQDKSEEEMNWIIIGIGGAVLLVLTILIIYMLLIKKKKAKVNSNEVKI